MTPPPQDPPQTVLDLLSTPGEDSFRAVLPGATEDLGHALENVPATLREAAVRETANAAEGLLDIDLIGLLVSGWQKHREIIAAAQRTVAAPGSFELVDLATHQITATQYPAVNLLVDNHRVATVELGLSVVFDISALVAGIRGGRLVAVHSGRCDVTATLAIQGTKVISRQVHLELPGTIPLGRGIRLLAGNGHPADPADETSQTPAASSPVLGFRKVHADDGAEIRVRSKAEALRPLSVDPGGPAQHEPGHNRVGNPVDQGAHTGPAGPFQRGDHVRDGHGQGRQGDGTAASPGLLR